MFANCQRGMSKRWCCARTRNSQKSDLEILESQLANIRTVNQIIELTFANFDQEVFQSAGATHELKILKSQITPKILYTMTTELTFENFYREACQSAGATHEPKILRSEIATKRTVYSDYRADF